MAEATEHLSEDNNSLMGNEATDDQQSPPASNTLAKGKKRVIQEVETKADNVVKSSGANNDLAEENSYGSPPKKRAGRPKKAAADVKAKLPKTTTVAETVQTNLVASDNDKSVAKKRAGRPKKEAVVAKPDATKAGRSKKAAVSVVSEEEDHDISEAEEEKVKGKPKAGAATRKAGRPKKEQKIEVPRKAAKVIAQSADEQDIKGAKKAASADSDAKQKRGAGRPKKVETEAVTKKAGRPKKEVVVSADEEEKEPSTRMAGRPKAVAKTSDDKVGKRGRPKKVVAAEVQDNDENYEN
uniref:H15 domain-containing protein n=1 Tax=Rhabditophanes sp. KR3021 TaxID=114890 RepID=A0AC35TS21_9BILA